MDVRAADDYLVARAREGYLPAFEELVRRHQVRAYTLAVRMLGDARDAEDVTQESFLRAWTALPSFQGQSSFPTWLHRIVVNQCLSLQRRHRPVPVPVDTEVAGPARTEEVVEAAARDDALHGAVLALPEDQRAALVLTAFMDCTYEEAADVLQVGVSTVRGRVARARRALLAGMGGWA
ncbi:hypothetical protein GCM10027586_18680 [Kineococcus gypseus]|uniref:RNA polymerase sigma factor n=1 Tax=Kineococcus gypseus TaxID=1637102 RepID=UPI003D7EDCF5